MPESLLMAKKRSFQSKNKFPLHPMALSENDFEWNLDGVIWCKMYRTKSDELCAVPVLLSAASILKKYREDAAKEGRTTIFSRISNQHANLCLKIIQQVCEIMNSCGFV